MDFGRQMLEVIELSLLSDYNPHRLSTKRSDTLELVVFGKQVSTPDTCSIHKIDLEILMSIWSRLKGHTGNSEIEKSKQQHNESEALIREIARDLEPGGQAVQERARESVGLEGAKSSSSESGAPIGQERIVLTEGELKVGGSSELSRPSRVVLESGLVTRGVLYLEDGDSLAGEHHGEIQCDGELTIEVGAVVDAVVSCDVLKVRGKVSGEIQARSSVIIDQGAEVSGKISTPEIEVEPGALVKGHLDMQVEGV
jgi:cytoskeletal protein CcmA (bactofilin family)